MTKEAINSKIKLALSKLYAHEAGLIENEADERTISAHLVGYLKQYFNGWNVDFGYNRDGRDAKKNSAGNRIFPDVTIHYRTPDRIERFSPENNLVAIEIKGHWNYEDRNKDEGKLRDMRKHYGYQYLFRVELEPESAELIQVE